MRWFFRFISITILSFLIQSVSMAEDKGLPRFYLDYGIVQNSLMNREGNYDDFLELAKIDRYAADFIARFWWAKAKKECEEFVDKIIRASVKKLKSNASDEEKEEMFKKVKAESNQCFYGVYYDNWSKINEMVKGRYERVLQEPKNASPNE